MRRGPRSVFAAPGEPRRNSISETTKTATSTNTTQGRVIKTHSFVILLCAGYFHAAMFRIIQYVWLQKVITFV